jgi:signal transduction histidine kinase
VRRALWPVLAAAGIAAEAAAFGVDDASDWVADLLTGWVLAGCGLVAWEGRPRSLVGPLLVATGGLWFAGTVSAAAAYAYRGPLLHVTLAYPGGRPRGRVQVLTVAAAYFAAVVAPVWRSEALTIVLSTAFTAAAGVHRRGAVGRERRERTYALSATAAVAGLFAATAGARLAVTTPSATDLSLTIFEAALALLAIALVRGLLREPWARTGATDLVVELTETRSGPLRDRLARALGDPTLQIGFQAGDGPGYVDAAGRPMALPPPGSFRRTTVLEPDAGAAVLIHDPALLDDPSLAMALAEAAQLAGANARLQAEVRAQFAELQASRRRLLAAADDERRRLEQRLQETAERRLAALLPELARARRIASGDPERAHRLARVADQLEHSLADVRRLAAGLHPRELATGGLAEAMHTLVERSPVPVELRVELPEHLPTEIERAAYFVCSESLANVAKYAGASRASVSVGMLGACLQVEVADDGHGGADPGAGTGLQGLRDRVEALGGTLTVDSPSGAGTRVVAEIPLRGSS